ncbi:MAG: sulfotransferase [bacterium]|nr:sulfotransferase [bacterium]
MNENQLDRPVLIVGTPRSGKSLITNVFRSAPEFCLVNEPLSIWNLGMPNRSDDCRSAEEATAKIREKILEACREQLMRSGKSRYLDNLAYHSLRISFANAVLPNAKIIFVTRDGRAAIPEMVRGWTMKTSIVGTARNTRRSINLRTLPRLALRFGVNYLSGILKGRRATWGPAVPGLREFSGNRAIAEVVAFQWGELNRIALEGLRSIPKERWIQVRFEDLIDRPEEEFLKIARFADVQSPDAVSQYASVFVSPNNIPKQSQWTAAEVSADEWEKIDPLIASMQRALGYSS